MISSDLTKLAKEAGCEKLGCKAQLLSPQDILQRGFDLWHELPNGETKRHRVDYILAKLDRHDHGFYDEVRRLLVYDHNDAYYRLGD